MTRTISLVQCVQIASPCPAKWEDMVGDDRMRYCESCKLNVYNLSAMSESEGEALIRKTEGRLCARVYRRADGTVLTRNCPVGLKALRKRITWVSARLAAALGFAITTTAYAIGGKPLVDHSEAAEMGDVALPREETTFHQASRTVNRWIVASPPQATAVILGGVAPPSPPPNICVEQRSR